MHQPILDLLSTPAARARRHDPQTSHLAADEVERSGTAEGQRRRCLRFATGNPGSTAAEIAKFAGMDRYAVNRRLPELRECGLLVNGLPRQCRVLGSECQTWLPSNSNPTR